MCFRLPKVQEKLLEEIKHYEEQNGTPFLVGGVPFQEFWNEKVLNKIQYYNVGLSD